VGRATIGPLCVALRTRLRRATDRLYATTSIDGWGLGSYTPSSQTNHLVLKLLIAEDNSPMRELLKSICAGDDDEVIECQTGWEAVRAHELHHPDWVLMDLSLPELDGIKAIEIIRAHHPHARIVVVTERPESAYGEQARQAGACEYVNKEELLRLPEILAQR